MAEFSRLVVTRKGQSLIAKILAGMASDVEFTKIAAADTAYTVDELERLESLPNIMQEAEISRKTWNNEVSVKLETAFSNVELTTGYHMQTLGLYVRDPDEGEILYAATVETSGNCYMPPYNGITVSGAYIQLVTTVGNADNVSLEVNPSVFATIGDINELRKLIDDIREFIGMDGSEGGWGEAIREHIEDQDNPHKVTAAQIDYNGKPLTAFLKSLEEVTNTDLAIQNIPTQYGPLTYNGEEQALVLNGYDPATILLTGVTKATDAGEYKAFATPQSPHYWGADGSADTKEITWRIERQPVNIPTQTNSLSYTGEEQAPTFEGIQADIMTLGGQLSGTAAGTYTATVTLDNNYQWPDGTHGELTIEWEIARITLEAIPAQSAPLSYSGAEQSPTWNGFDADKMTMSGPTSATGAGSYTVEVAPGSISLNMNTIELRVSAMSALIAVITSKNNSRNSEWKVVK